MQDELGGGWKFESGIAPTSWSYNSSYTTFISSNGAPPINAILAEQPDQIDVFEIEESEFAAFEPLALTTFIYGQSDGIIQPDAADGNPTELAYSCDGSRLFSLQGLKAKDPPQAWNSYWEASNWTNQWVKVTEDGACEMPLDQFVTVVPEEGGYVRLYAVAPLSPIKQID